MTNYLGMFLDSLAQSGHMQLAQQEAARQQQQLELEKQRQQTSQQITLADLLSNGATPVNNGQVQAPAPQPSLMRGDNGSIQPTMNLNGPMTSMAADPSRGTVNVGGQQLQIESPDERNASDTAQAVSRAKALYPIGKVPLSKEGAAATGGMLREGDLIDPSHAGYLGTIVAANKRAESAQARLDAKEDQGPKLVGHTITADDSGRQVLVQTFSDGSTKELPLSSRGKTKETNADRSMTPNEVAVHKQQAIEDYRRSLDQEQKLSTDRLRIGTALSSGQHYVDAKGGLHPFNRTEGDPKAQTPEQIKAMKDDMRQRYEEATNGLFSVIAQKNDAIERAGGHPLVSTDEAIQRLGAAHAHNVNNVFKRTTGPNPEATATPTQRTSANVRALAPPNGSGTPTPSAPVPAGPKIATLEDIGAWAQAAGVSRAEAIRRFGAKGYKITNAPGH